MRKNINLELNAALRTVCQPNSKIFIVVYLENFHKINIWRLMCNFFCIGQSGCHSLMWLTINVILDITVSFNLGDVEKSQ